MATITCDAAGVLELRAGDAPLARAELLFTCEDQGSVWRQTPGHTDLAGTAGGWHASLAADAVGPGLTRITIRVSPCGDRVLQTVCLRIQGGQGSVPEMDTPDTRMLALPNDISCTDGARPLEPGVEVLSHMMTMLVPARSGPSFLVGMGDIPEDITWFQSDGPALRAGYRLNRALPGPVSLTLVLAAGDDPFALLAAYGDYLAQFARPPAPVMTGWNTWDYYWRSIRMRDVRSEMKAIQASPLREHLRVIMLDSGWERAHGEWTPNRKFPAGLGRIADEIKAAGFVPGIWTCPLRLTHETPLARHRPDLLARGQSGQPVQSAGDVLLDFTLPEVQSLLAKWYGKLYRAGFRFFKTDYAYLPMLDLIESTHDPRVGRAAMLRRGFETLRAAVGEDSHILDGWTPQEVTLGIADSVRLSLDIHNFWGHIRMNAIQIAARLWQNGRLWRVDPDFAIVRAMGETTSDTGLNLTYNARPLEPGGWHWFAGPEATLSEMRCWLTLVHLSGGNVFLGDSIARLNARGLDLLLGLFPPLEHSAVPLDLFVNHPPRFWLAPAPDGPLLGVFNWEDDEADMAPPPGIDVPRSGTDLETGERVAVNGGSPMAPRSSRLLRV